MAARELLEADGPRAASRAMRKDRAPHSTETNNCHVVAHAYAVVTAPPLPRILRFVNENTSRWIIALGRIGYLAKGLIFICIGLLSATAAMRGRGGRATDSRGVLQAIVQQPFGNALLLALIGGLVCYILWRTLAALLDLERRGSDWKGLAMRARSLFVAVLYCGIAAAAVKTLTGSSRGGSGGDRAAQDWTATALATPFGKWTVMLIGLAVIAGGLYQLYRAYTEKFEDKLELGTLAADVRERVVRICAFGIGARGIVFAVAGGLLVQAGLLSNPAKARGLGGALNALHAQPFGRYLFGVVAAGLAAYGVYCCVRARYGRIG